MGSTRTLRRFLSVSILILVHHTVCNEIQKYSLLMPNVTPYRPELYLCTPIKVDMRRSYYIVGFEPNSTMETAHHILLYGCGKPGSTNPVWNCGEMADGDSEEQSASPCGEGSQIIYAWARDAPMLKLPEGVGFKVGKDSEIQYLVLQVHYAHIDQFRDGSKDNSGIFLHYTFEPLTKLAGVVLLGTAGEIKPKGYTNMETMCTIKEDKVIHPFAYRTHTHSLGKVVSGYHITEDSKGTDHWLLLGKRDPLTPQMFYPVADTTPIKKGDKLGARCTMLSNRERYTYIGATNNDEMCNFYLMYWVENTSTLDMKYCFTQGPPNYYWNNEKINNIPTDAPSSL